jgi:hypothetical protein
VTGAAFNGSTIYAFGNIYGSTTQFSVHKYTTAGSSSGQYMNQLDFPGLQPAVYDIAWSAAGVWVARDESDSPVLRYDTSGNLTGYVSGTEVPAAAGLTVDSSGYLWVSDPVNDKIYKVDTSTSVEEGHTTPMDTRIIQPEMNPFPSSAFVTVSGFGPGARAELYDVLGRIVQRPAVSDGVLMVEGSALPPGTYVLRVFDSGGSSTVRLCRI